MSANSGICPSRGSKPEERDTVRGKASDHVRVDPNAEGNVPSPTVFGGCVETSFGPASPFPSFIDDYMVGYTDETEMRRGKGEKMRTARVGPVAGDWTGHMDHRLVSRWSRAKQWLNPCYVRPR